MAEAVAEVSPETPLRILFEDEGCFGRISDQRRCWAPLPLRPEVGRQVVRQFIYSLAAVCPYDGAISSLLMPRLDTEVMSIFLAHLKREFPAEFCLLFMDSAGWHIAGKLRVPAGMKLVPLPPYSPELNPVEGVWEYVRENYTGNRTFGDLEQVETALCQALHQLMHQPGQVQSLTCFSWLNTLSLTAN